MKKKTLMISVFTNRRYSDILYCIAVFFPLEVLQGFYATHVHVNTHTIDLYQSF